MSQILAASQKTQDWLARYYSYVDTMRVDELLTFFAPDATLTFANYPPAKGREGIRAALGGVLGAIAGISHKVKTLWETADGVIVYEVDVTYSRKDGRDVIVPGAAISRVQDEMFLEQQIYVDLTPVFA